MEVSMDTSQFKLPEANQAFKNVGQKSKDFGFENVGQKSEKESEFGMKDVGQKGGLVNVFA